MLVPESLGGAAVDVPSSIEILMALAVADGATAWCAMIGCHAPLMFSVFPLATLQEIYANGPDVIAGGSTAPKGSATRVEGGYRVSGRWPYASGCNHADWMFGVCVEAGSGPPGQATSTLLRFVVLPGSDWQIVDTWRSAGLRGTGSHDISLSEVFVPLHRTAVFGVPGPAQQREPGLYMSHHQVYLQLCAVAVGISMGALSDLGSVAEHGARRLWARQDLADTPLFQHRLGHADVEVQAAYAYLRDLARTLWTQTGELKVDPSLAARIPPAATWIVETCLHAVDSCFRAAGASAVYDSSPLQRRLRDIHTLAQHILVQEASFGLAGAQRIGKGSPL
jgi:alkylation response protein AidB-like acyl-CoA dehydrogenase